MASQIRPVASQMIAFNAVAQKLQKQIKLT